jgi:cardiolipin synthase C
VLRFVAAFASLVLRGCASQGFKQETVEEPTSFAWPPADAGISSTLASEVIAKHGNEFSGFDLLDCSAAGLTWRLALIDSAVSSIDVQTYLWYPDKSGRLLLERVVHAAQKRR